MMTWTPVLIALIALTVLVQGVVLVMVFGKGTAVFDMQLMDRRCRDLAASLATVAFFGYTFVTSFFGRNNLWKFIEALPFQPVYVFAKSWLTVPAGRDDIRWIYAWIWIVLAFMVPCIVFVMLNSALSGVLWQRFRVRRHDEE